MCVWCVCVCVRSGVVWCGVVCVYGRVYVCDEKTTDKIRNKQVKTCGANEPT